MVRRDVRRVSLRPEPSGSGLFWCGPHRTRLTPSKRVGTSTRGGSSTVDSNLAGSVPGLSSAPVSPLRDWVEGSCEFQIAHETEALDGAFRLVHDQYVTRRYMFPHPSGRRLSLYHALPSTRVFVATEGLRIVGTATLIQDSPAGLPMDQIYRDDLDRLRGQGRRLCEGSALAVDCVHEACGRDVTLRLAGMLVLYAAEVAAMDELCIAVHPRHVRFYERWFHARVFGELKSYQYVSGAPAQALHLDLDLIRDLSRQLRSDRGPDHGRRSRPSRLDAVLYGPDSPYRRMREFRQVPARGGLTPEQVEYFFAGREFSGERGFAVVPDYEEALVPVG